MIRKNFFFLNLLKYFMFVQYKNDKKKQNEEQHKKKNKLKLCK